VGEGILRRHHACQTFNRRLHLENGRYQLFMRSMPGQTAASKLLSGFEVPVTALLQE
jgi:hypothetical protein